MSKPICPACGNEALMVFPDKQGCNRCRVVVVTEPKKSKIYAEDLPRRRMDFRQRVKIEMRKMRKVQRAI